MASGGDERGSEDSDERGRALLKIAKLARAELTSIASRGLLFATAVLLLRNSDGLPTTLTLLHDY